MRELISFAGPVSRGEWQVSPADAIGGALWSATEGWAVACGQNTTLQVDDSIEQKLRVLCVR